MVKNDDFRALARPELEAAVAEERRRLDRREARWLGMVAELDRRRTEDASVAESTTSWLAQVCRLSPGEAAGKVALARSLAAMPLTLAAVAAGDISPSHARALAEAHRAHPETFAEHETALVAAARTLSVRQVRKAVAYWRQAQDYDAALGAANRLYEQRRLHVSETFGGMGRIDGDADPESHATIRTALEAADDGATDPDDRRSPAQRRLDALVKVCRHYLDTANTPVTGGERPHVGVIMDLPSLEARAGRRCELDRYGVIHPKPPAASPATQPSAASSPTPTANPSTWAAAPASFPLRCAAPSRRATAAAATRVATSRRGSATLTTSSTGPMAAPPTSPTSSCCAAATTASTTRARCRSTLSRHAGRRSRREVVGGSVGDLERRLDGGSILGPVTPAR